MEYQKCSLCGYLKGKFFLKLKDDRQIFACPSCGNAFTVPAPSANYDNHSFFSLAEADGPTWRLYSRRIIRFLQKHRDLSGTLLDVGCSHGLLLEEAQSVGFQAEGIEPSRAAADYCIRKGLKVTRGYLKEGAFVPESFDVVVLSHVLEHVADPVNLLQTVRKILKPKGQICLSQTNFTGTLPRFLGRRWGAWVANEHYYHFSPAGIITILKTAGYHATSIQLSPLGYSWDLTYKSFKDIKASILRNFCYIISTLKIGMPFTGDQMYVLAECSID